MTMRQVSVGLSIRRLGRTPSLKISVVGYFVLVVEVQLTSVLIY